MLTAGEKTPDYPLGYGCCQCGCGKTTSVIGDVHLKYFRSSHYPKVRKNILARQQAKQLAPESTKHKARQILDNLTPPQIIQPTIKAIAKVQGNERLARTVAWTKVNQNFIKWHRRRLRARTNETARRYIRGRRESDPAFKLISYIRGRIGIALKSKGAKKGAKTELLVGCSIQELKNHLQTQFKTGMTWDNYGDWHVDHIRPCCSFDLIKIEEQKICFHYTNLQPLWAAENFKKNGRYKPELEKLL
jgi:hypothetical protein